MADIYAPDEAAKPTDREVEAILAQRDLSLPLPINYVTDPGVSLTAACFGDKVYDEVRLWKCLSNLLAVGFRRYDLDLWVLFPRSSPRSPLMHARYWDQGRGSWSFCPVAMPPGEYVQDIIPTVTVDPTVPPVVATQAPGLPGASTTTEAPKPIPIKDLESLGPYKCSPGAILSAFSRLLSSYNLATQNTLEARLTYFTFNIHAAADHENPTSPAPSPTSMPREESLIGSLINGNLSAYIYTPRNLENNRANLNSSWFTVPERYRPITDYYSIIKDGDGIWSTPDGWPSESFIEFSNSKRTLLQFGQVDPQMVSVISDNELEVIFPPNSIQMNQTDISYNGTGALTKGCYVHSSDTDLSDSNSTWASASLSSLSLFRDLNMATSSDPGYASFDMAIPESLINCGISSFLNTTLRTSADQDFRPYKALVDATIWSFAPSEPKSYNSSASSGKSGINLYRCATTDATGRWAVADCGLKHLAACRAAPLNWTISSFAVAYSFGSSACPKEYTFSVPGSALENAYLQQAILRSKDYKAKGSGDPGPGVLLNVNSLDVGGCWVPGQGGTNGTCPYDSGDLAEFSRQRTIVVPTVAAVIVLVVTVLTLATKGWGNRRSKKKRERSRRGNANGFVYEGVPS